MANNFASGLLAYTEYLLKFCTPNLTLALKDSAKLYITDDEKKDLLVKDLLAVSKSKFEKGTGYDEIEAALVNDFSYMDLNSRINFSEFKYFFEVYIKSKQTVACGSVVEAKAFYNEFYTNAISLSDSLYKVNACMFLLNSITMAHLIGELSTELENIIGYLNAYAIDDIQFQDRLSKVFRITS
ncbi:MAG: hypothetical protein RR365_00900 [Bacteroides sp.]